jgi:hypothetical protein
MKKNSIKRAQSQAGLSFAERLRVGEPCSGMDVNHLIRFHFAKRDETLLAALDRLSEMDAKAKNYR